MNTPNKQAEEKISHGLLEVELGKFIEAVGINILETKRIMDTKESISEFEQGRNQGIFLFGKDMIDNLKSFGFRTGILK